jgi:serine/threonine protein kinase
MPGPCPTVERLAAALRGRQRDGQDAELAAHISECPVCQAQLEALAGGSGWLEAKARTHASTASAEMNALKQTIATLESHPAISEHERPPPSRLDFLQPSDQPSVLGRFGPYEVITHVASGGMGIVLKARDPALNRIVALKILPPTLATNALARSRFVREARAAAAVVHDHVVPIYAVDECGGLPYLVMQFIQGRSLAERIRATCPLQLEEILRIGAQAAAGLAAAHAQGLVHRDVKPGNILLENSVERVKLTDFGLARAADDAGLTRTGELAGTPEFMSPEQAGNEAVDHRSDLFSFGSVLYAMGTGHSPFQATSVIAAVRKVCDARPPPVHEVNPAIPIWFSDIVARLMAKVPGDRFQSAREVSELLERYLARVQHGELGELSGISKPRGATVRVQRRVVIGSAVGLAMVGLVFFALKNRRAVTSNSSPTPSALESRETKRPPSASIQEPFVVLTEAGTSVGGFARIEDALAGAPAGAVIELCWNGSRDIDPVRLPAKPLTLRAGRGFQPVWSSSDSASALSASAALTLEGVRFVMTRARRGPFSSDGPNRPRTPPSGLASLSITNGPLRIDQCTFEAKGGATEQACIVLVNVGVARVESTLFYAPAGKAIVWQQYPGENTEPAGGAAQLTVTNCLTHAAETLWLDLRESTRARLEIARCTFHGLGTFCVPASLTTTNLEVTARQNVFHTASVILDSRGSTSPPLPQCLHWREQENLYKPPQGLRYIASTAVPNGPARLEDWNRWWNQTGANSRVVQLTFANGASDLKRGPGSFPPDPDGFRITNLILVEGPPTERDQWSRFGADTGNVGPRSAK